MSFRHSPTGNFDTGKFMGRLLIAGLVALLMAIPAHAALKDGDTPPDLLGKDRDGHPVRISDSHGKVVIVTFWASWCGYCMQELPILEGIQANAGKDRLQVIAVNDHEDRDLYWKMLRRLKNVQVTIVRGDNALSDAFDVHGLPHMVLIDPDGRIAHVQEGYSQDELPALIDRINQLLHAAKAAEPAA